MLRIELLLQLEAAAAVAYLAARAGVQLPCARRDSGRVPDHWKTFASRSSPVTGSPPDTVNPGNAILNYLYGILETGARISGVTVGLDLGIWFLHMEQK